MSQFQFTCPSRSTTTEYKDFRKQQVVSIHVPLAEHDLKWLISPGVHVSFQFTCPSRSTTVFVPFKFVRINVSIHVPLAEHDAIRLRA